MSDNENMENTDQPAGQEEQSTIQPTETPEAQEQPRPSPPMITAVQLKHRRKTVVQMMEDKKKELAARKAK